MSLAPFWPKQPHGIILHSHGDFLITQIILLSYNSAYFISLNTKYQEGGKKEGKERGREGEREEESINITQLSPQLPTCLEGREGRPAFSNLGGKKILQEIPVTGIMNSLLRTRIQKIPISSELCSTSDGVGTASLSVQNH